MSGRPQVGDVQRDSRGTWIVVGAYGPTAALELSRVRVGSLAHEIMARTDLRLRIAEPKP